MEDCKVKQTGRQQSANTTCRAKRGKVPYMGNYQPLILLTTDLGVLTSVANPYHTIIKNQY